MVRPTTRKPASEYIHIGSDVLLPTATIFGQLRQHFGSRKAALEAAINLLANELSEGIIRCVKCRGKAEIGHDVQFGDSTWRLCAYCVDDEVGLKEWMVLEVKRSLR